MKFKSFFNLYFYFVIFTQTTHRHVVNVTPDLENVFEGCSDIRYLRVPIDDHSWNQQNVQHYLNRAVSFIGVFVYVPVCTFVDVLKHHYR